MRCVDRHSDEIAVTRALGPAGTIDKPLATRQDLRSVLGAHSQLSICVWRATELRAARQIISLVSECSAPLQSTEHSLLILPSRENQSPQTLSRVFFSLLTAYKSLPTLIAVL